MGANQYPVNLPPQPHERRTLIMIAGLIYHPEGGLILFDTGSCEDIVKSWGQKAMECSPRTWEKAVHGLPEAIKATGAGEITDVRAVILSHLHCDHAGGLEHFLDTGQFPLQNPFDDDYPVLIPAPQMWRFGATKRSSRTPSGRLLLGSNVARISRTILMFRA